MSELYFPSLTSSGINYPVHGPQSYYKRDLNEHQQRAVCRVVDRYHYARSAHQMSAPYIIFGPPGTGKTVTLVESVLQILKADSSSKVLLCAPSNTAADLLCERLKMQLDTTKMIRVNAYSRNVSDVPPSVQNYCTQIDGTTFAFPRRDAIMEKQVVVVTCVTAGRLFSIGVPNSHFSVIAIDEAGQAHEPEILVCLEGLVSVATLVVLAGDHKQLGPVIRSTIASGNGLAMSMLERLAARPIYERKEEMPGHHDPRFMTKLLHNYRSHREILDVPNHLFYNNDLIPAADRAVTDAFLGWAELPNPNIPCVFHGVLGTEMREGNSPSWFNPDEAMVVNEWIQKVRKYKRAGCSASGIGVISPYRRQVDKIKQLLKHSMPSDYKSLMVGSVENFQGQERRVIIVSIVRSQAQFLAFDAKYNLGFLDNPKRFNVATTRPQALLVVVGNPLLAADDASWGTFLRRCIASGAYQGSPLPAQLRNTDGGGGSSSVENDGSIGGGGDADPFLLDLMTEMEQLGLTNEAPYAFQDDDSFLLDLMTEMEQLGLTKEAEQ